MLAVIDIMVQYIIQGWCL